MKSVISKNIVACCKMMHTGFSCNPFHNEIEWIALSETSLGFEEVISYLDAVTRIAQRHPTDRYQLYRYTELRYCCV